MSEAFKSVGAITMFIDDTQRSKAFYEQVFGAKVVHEDGDAVAFEFENMVVNMLCVPAAHELIAPAPVGDAGVPRRFQLTIWVQDTDAVCEQLAARGVELLNCRQHMLQNPLAPLLAWSASAKARPGNNRADTGLIS